MHFLKNLEGDWSGSSALRAVIVTEIDIDDERDVKLKLYELDGS